MNTSAVQRQVLSSAIEDAFGLYEVLWEINTNFPDAEEGERRQEATRAVETLLSKGWVGLFRRPWRTGRGVEDFLEPIPPHEWPGVLREDQNWEPPRWNTYVVVHATAAGREAYYSGTGT